MKICSHCGRKVNFTNTRHGIRMPAHKTPDGNWCKRPKGHYGLKTQQVKSASRKIVIVGWDGASWPMYRYFDQLPLREHKRTRPTWAEIFEQFPDDERARRMASGELPGV